MGQYFDAQVDTSHFSRIIKQWEKRSPKVRSKAMQIAAELLRSAVDDRYENEGYGDWPPLAEATILARRNKSRGGTKILQDTGILAGSTDVRHGPDFAEASTNTEYIVYHLEGGPIIPKRNPFELREQDFNEVQLEIMDLIDKDLFGG